MRNRSRRSSPWLAFFTLLASGSSCRREHPGHTHADGGGLTHTPADAQLAEADAGPAEAEPASIWRENMRPGVRHEDPNKPAEAQVAGYSSAVSAAPGETIQLFVNVDHAQSVRWQLYRVGHYAGLGTRLVAQSTPRPVAVQPACQIDAGSGMIECDWAAAFDVKIEPAWVSGYYFFELINADGYGARVPFVVKEGSRRAAGLAQVSVNTWQAYNKWGGISIYANEHRNGPYTQGSAHTVSFDRPYQSQNEFLPFLNLVRFLEQRGYDLSYTTNIDVDADASVVSGRKLFLTLAHDEYWTVAERDALDAARDQGVSLAFLSANTGYWRVRLEDSARGPRRRLTTYKSASMDPVKDSPQTTNMFREEPYARPENALIGVGYRTWGKVPGFPYIVTNADHWTYAGTGVHTHDALSAVVGSEWDGVTDNGRSPAGLEVLARAITIDNDGAFIEGEANATLYYPTPQSLVFAAGSIYWGLGLAQGPFADPRVERMTENVLARAGLEAATPLTEPPPRRAASATYESRVLAGDGAQRQTDGAALTASFVAPTGVAAAPDGTLYVVDRGDHVLRALGPDGTLRSVLGKDSQGFKRPMGVAADAQGVLYLSDSRTHRIYRVTGGNATPYAGVGAAGNADASDPLEATFSGPRGLALGPDGALYVADTMNNAIRRIDAAGVTTIATDLRLVSGVAVGPDNAVYFSTIGKGQLGVVRGGQVKLLANLAGVAGDREGPAEQARLQPQEGLLVDGDRLLFTDTENNRVRALSLQGDATITTVYGDGNAAADASDAQHTWLPRGIARFAGGFAVTDFGSQRVLWFKER